MEHFNPILGNDTPGQKFITCGEIMLRLTPPNYEKIRMASGFEASYGGSEANIALALANLGVDSTFFSVVPNNSLGKSAVRWLRSNDVHCTPMILTSPEETPTPAPDQEPEATLLPQETPRPVETQLPEPEETEDWKPWGQAWAELADGTHTAGSLTEVLAWLENALDEDENATVYIRVSDEITAENSGTIAKLFEAIPKVAEAAGLTNGYRIVNNCGPDACQSVQHIHFHLLGGKQLADSMA